WAKLTGLPIVQMALMQLHADPKFAEVMRWYNDPANQELLGLLADMVSHEIFLYGGANSASTFDLAAQLVGATRFGPAMMQITGQGVGLSQQELMAASVFHVLASHLDLLQVPDLVFGFKLSKTARAESQLKRLE